MLNLPSPHSEWESLAWRISKDCLVLCTIMRGIWSTLVVPYLLEHNNIHTALNLEFLKRVRVNQRVKRELGCVRVLFFFFVLYFGLVGRKSLSKKRKKICHLNQFIIPSFSINKTLIFVVQETRASFCRINYLIPDQGVTLFNSVFIGNKGPSL